MSQPNTRGATTLWPRLEIGKSSATPWSRPRMIACPYVIGAVRITTKTQPCPAVGNSNSVVVLASAVAAAGRVGLVCPVDDLELLERPAGAYRDARQRRFSQVHGHLRLGPEPVG